MINYPRHPSNKRTPHYRGDSLPGKWPWFEGEELPIVNLPPGRQYRLPEGWWFIWQTRCWGEDDNLGSNEVGYTVLPKCGWVHWWQMASPSGWTNLFHFCLWKDEIKQGGGDQMSKWILLVARGLFCCSLLACFSFLWSNHRIVK